MEMITLEQIGANALIVAIMVIVGYLATDRAKIHQCGLFPFLDKVHWVFISSAIVGVVFTITKESDWLTVFKSYLLANLLYSHFVKKIISLTKKPN